jgi:hypothetical protein
MGLLESGITAGFYLRFTTIGRDGRGLGGPLTPPAVAAKMDKRTQSDIDFKGAWISEVGESHF